MRRWRERRSHTHTLREVCRCLHHLLWLCCIIVGLLYFPLIWDYSNCWHFCSSDSSNEGFISQSAPRRLFSFPSLMRWNVAKLAAERQSFIYTTIKWSFTKHTQYALDVGFVKIGWPPYALQMGRGVYLDAAQWWEMPNWNHPSQCNKKACSALSEWEEWDVCIGPLRFPLWQRECANERVNVKKQSFY